MSTVEMTVDGRAYLTAFTVDTDGKKTCTE